jgi:hypothetical protein
MQLHALLHVCKQECSGAASPEAAPGTPLHRDANRNTSGGIPAVEQVIAVVYVGDVDVVGVVPVVRPGSWPWINEAKPIATVLEARVSADNQEGQALDSESMRRSKVATEPIVRNAVANVAATLLPSAVV